MANDNYKNDISSLLSYINQQITQNNEFLDEDQQRIYSILANPLSDDSRTI